MTAYRFLIALSCIYILQCLIMFVIFGSPIFLIYACTLSGIMTWSLRFMAQRTKEYPA